MPSNDDDIIEDTEAEILVDDEEIVEETGLAEKLKKLRGELRACQSEKADYLAGWQRAKADFINARRDEEKTRSEFTKYATEKVLREMLVIADSLEKISNADGTAIYKQLMDLLKKEGVVPIEAKGLIFNPMYHEALGEVETKQEKEDSMVL
ncbi:MAG: nucleotide exchange factor GrpE, partial [bacterium]|nr:nucleotide exchange factor GrpE [bacterium]